MPQKCGTDSMAHVAMEQFARVDARVDVLGYKVEITLSGRFRQWNRGCGAASTQNL